MRIRSRPAPFSRSSLLSSSTSRTTFVQICMLTALTPFYYTYFSPEVSLLAASLGSSYSPLRMKHKKERRNKRREECGEGGEKEKIFKLNGTVLFCFVCFPVIIFISPTKINNKIIKKEIRKKKTRAAIFLFSRGAGYASLSFATPAVVAPLLGREKKRLVSLLESTPFASLFQTRKYANATQKADSPPVLAEDRIEDCNHHTHSQTSLTPRCSRYYALVCRRNMLRLASRCLAPHTRACAARYLACPAPAAVASAGWLSRTPVLLQGFGRRGGGDRHMGGGGGDRRMRGGGGGDRRMGGGGGGGGGMRDRRGGGGDRKRPPMFPNTTGDGELTAETRAAMRDDALITSHILRCIPPNGAISVKSLNAQLPEEIQEALCEKHNGLSSFLRERQQLFIVKPRPEDQVLFVAGNPIAIQKYASREMQKKTMRAMMGLDSGSGGGRRGGGGGGGGGRGRGGGGRGMGGGGNFSGGGRGGPRGGGMGSGRGSFGGGGGRREEEGGGRKLRSTHGGKRGVEGEQVRYLFHFDSSFYYYLYIFPPLRQQQQQQQERTEKETARNDSIPTHKAMRVDLERGRYGVVESEGSYVPLISFTPSRYLYAYTHLTQPSPSAIASGHPRQLFLSLRMPFAPSTLLRLAVVPCPCYSGRALRCAVSSLSLLPVALIATQCSSTAIRGGGALWEGRRCMALRAGAATRPLWAAAPPGSSAAATTPSEEEREAQKEALRGVLRDVRLKLHSRVPIGDLFRLLTKENQRVLAKQRLPLEEFLLHFPGYFRTFRSKIQTNTGMIQVCPPCQAHPGVRQLQLPDQARRPLLIEIAEEDGACGAVAFQATAPAQSSEEFLAGAPSRLTRKQQLELILANMPDEFTSFITMRIPQRIKEECMGYPSVKPKEYFQKHPQFFDVRDCAEGPHTFYVRRKMKYPFSSHLIHTHIFKYIYIYIYIYNKMRRRKR
eukprot:gene9292-6532_t